MIQFHLTLGDLTPEQTSRASGAVIETRILFTIQVPLVFGLSGPFRDQFNTCFHKPCARLFLIGYRDIPFCRNISKGPSGRCSCLHIFIVLGAVFI